MKIYAGQTNITITLDTGIDLSSADTTQIKWKKGNTEGYFNSTVSGTNLVYQVQDNDLTVGDMIIWAYIVFSDGKIGIGEASTVKIYKQSQ